MDGVIGGDYQHEVGDVGLVVTSCSTSSAFNVVTSNHTCIDSCVGVVDALHVTG